MDWKTRAMRVWRSVRVNLETIWSTSGDERMSRDISKEVTVKTTIPFLDILVSPSSQPQALYYSAFGKSCPRVSDGIKKIPKNAENARKSKKSWGPLVVESWPRTRSKFTLNMIPRCIVDPLEHW